MKTKLLSLTAATCALFLLVGCTQTDTAPQQSSDPAAVITDIATTQYFTDEAVSESDLETILAAGVNAPSAMNGQPWHFSVISDASVLQQIADDMSSGMKFGGMTPPEGFTPPEGMERPEGFTPPEGTERPEGFTPPEGMAPPSAGSGMNKAGLTDAPLAIVISCKNGSEFDAGLACQNMSAAAQLLGYGTKIISSPTIALNGEKQAEYRELLGIPEDRTAVAILLIGKEDTSVDTSIDGYTGASVRNPLEETVSYIKAK